MTPISDLSPLITQNEYHLLQQLREQESAQNPPIAPSTWKQQLADIVATAVGSWGFILIQIPASITADSLESRC